MDAGAGLFTTELWKRGKKSRNKCPSFCDSLGKFWENGKEGLRWCMGSDSERDLRCTWEASPAGARPSTCSTAPWGMWETQNVLCYWVAALGWCSIEGFWFLQQASIILVTLKIKGLSCLVCFAVKTLDSFPLSSAGPPAELSRFPSTKILKEVISGSPEAHTVIRRFKDRNSCHLRQSNYIFIFLCIGQSF